MTVNDFSSKLKNLRSAMIFCHVRPDGDTLSCAFALYYAFKKLGKNAKVVCLDDIPQKHLTWIPFVPSKELNDGYDGYISVDTATPELMGNAYNFFKKQSNTFIIDHHYGNLKFAKYCFVKNRPACALIIYEILVCMGVEFDKQIAQMIYYGVCADTGNFSYGGVDSNTFAVASKLVEYGASPTDTYNILYRSNPKEREGLFANVISKIKYYHDGKLAIITTTKGDMEAFNATKDMTEGFVDYLTTIDGVQVGVSLLEERQRLYRVSFRSKKVPVDQIAGTFGGGGHTLASGAVLSGYYEDILDKLVFVVGNYLI